MQIYVLKVILETAYVIVQLDNSVSLLWLDQTIQLQLFLILATIPLNPLNCTFYLRKLIKDAMVIVTENVAQVLVVFHI